MKTVTPDYVKHVIDFAPTDEQKSRGFADIQLEGTVTLFNMLLKNSCAYLADEVGMGKTYTALGVMSLFRHFNPKARIVIIAPRENIQHKWIKEKQNFVRNNWLVTGNRVKGIDGTSSWQSVYCSSLLDFAHESLLDADRDFFLRMTSFSLAVKDPERRKLLKKRLAILPLWIRRIVRNIRVETDFKKQYAASINASIQKADLVIVDEAHNLKHGFGLHVSTRNQMMATVWGRPDENLSYLENYGVRAKKVLFLSATPFEESYDVVRNQLDIFGKGNIRVRNAAGGPALKISSLADKEVSDKKKREVLDCIMLRRVTQLRIAGQIYTKNMYRREWRSGGYEQHDEPMEISDSKQKLIIALMQKKVAEILQDERFNNHFQIGMLSSFESFVESASRSKRHKLAIQNSDTQDEAVFDGNQTADESEKKGIDTNAIAAVVESYRQQFKTSLPHPKLDSTAEALKIAFDTGDKSLVFVRRVATVKELGGKLNAYFDDWILQYMKAGLPEMHSEIEGVFSEYKKFCLLHPDEIQFSKEDDIEYEDDEPLEDLIHNDSDDDGSSETFFSWFFRGKGPAGYLSGASFQKSRLSSASAVYSTLFEEDYISWLLKRPNKPLKQLAKVLDIPYVMLVTKLRAMAYFQLTKAGYKLQKGRYPRLYVYESYQKAALILLADVKNVLGEKAEIVLHERYHYANRNGVEQPPKGFPDPEVSIGANTFITELVKNKNLRKKIWPRETSGDFQHDFRRGEQRRELISVMARLGASYIDLYLLAIHQVRSFKMGARSSLKNEDRNLAKNFVNLLAKQETADGFHAYYELSNAASAFDLIIATNFPSVPDVHLSELLTLYGETLQRQVPVGKMAGNVQKRLVRQFRMPGFPLVLITTDVLQEGEDLHTFCRNIVHYGIAWTPSAMEQRTGRIDRIGSLVQRQIERPDRHPEDDNLLQVYYPHLKDTVEVLQVRRVVERLNKFMSLIHKHDKSANVGESKLDVAHAILEDVSPISAIEGELQSAFPTCSEWLEGNLNGSKFKFVDGKIYFVRFNTLWKELKLRLGVNESPVNKKHVKAGEINISVSSSNTKVPFTLEMRSQVAGDAVLIRCICRVFDKRLDEELIGWLSDIQTDLGGIKLCVTPQDKEKGDCLTIENDILFNAKTTKVGELIGLVERTVSDATEVREYCSYDE